MPSDTPPARVKKAWRMPGRADSERACSMAKSAFRSLKGCSLEAWHGFEIRVGDGDGLEQLAHAGAAFAEQPLTGGIDLGGLLRRSVSLQRRGALVDAEIAQQPRLIDRTVNARAHAFGGKGDGFEVDMGREIDLAGRDQR